MLKGTYPYYLGNKPASPNADLKVINKYTGEVATRVALADRTAIDRAIGLAQAAAKPMQRFQSYKRAEVLHYAVHRFMKTPAQSNPSRHNNAAAVELSTPPLSATRTFFLSLAIGSDLLVILLRGRIVNWIAFGFALFNADLFIDYNNGPTGLRSHLGFRIIT